MTKLYLSILPLLALTACGDSNHPVTYSPYEGEQETAPTAYQVQQYNLCVARNPNVVNSPQWLFWISECKRIWQINY